ncbi:MAG: 3-oxoadipate enol-lactonase [Candidatus Rokubacteria bacterium]|nr:3-oxoadipate enol-lactonase [Candidatus Rokubacteria bacterium]MBI2158321.1 3-oxoadipate enol-lactonase [Candidatus Rokubacteria bacterium]MBI2493054.1 3-oxoadipate enol-lactonase [Candidatus Rokubacteria bacterium]
MKVTANGIGVSYTLDGPAGAPVVTLSHSLAATSAMWEPQLKALTARWRVLRYDTRGHGGTDAPAGAYTLDQLAEDARQLLAALGVTTTHFVGLSMGGMIGQTLALKAPELFASLVLCDTSSRVPPEARPTWEERIRTAETQGMEPMVEATIGRWFTAPFRDARRDVVDPVRAMIRATPPRGYAGCCHAISQLDLTDRLPAITIPTLVIVGEEDQGTPVAASRAIQERIKGAELVVLKSAAHLSNLEQPEAFTRALTAFLDRVGR